MSGTSIEVADVAVVRQGRPILDVERLRVGASEILAIVGPNGAGKSTLVRVMGLLLRPERGRVMVDGEVVGRANEKAARRKLACVFQSPHLLNRTVRANVELGLRFRGVPSEERARRVDLWLGKLGLEHLAPRMAKSLSGGEAQRVNLARALALNPSVLLLDEPLGGLDTPTRHALLDELGPLIRNGAGAGLIVTHDRRVALTLGDRVAVMFAGQVRQQGPPEDVFARPADEQVARFVGVENLIPARVLGSELEIKGVPALQCEVGLDGEVTLCLRAEEVRLGASDAAGDPNSNNLRGTVVRVMRRGVGFAAEVDVGVKLVARLTRVDRSLLSLENGQRVTVRIRPSALHRVPRA